IYAKHVNADGFYHTDVGRALKLLRLHHPDEEYTAKVYGPLRRLLDFYQKDRDREGMDLYDIRDQFETGQEYTSRYFFADDRADSYGWDHRLRLKGVDVTSYVYGLSAELLELAWQQQRVDDIRVLSELQAHIQAAVNAFLWDAERGWYMDYSAQKKEHSHYVASVGCYPVLFGLAAPQRALRVGERLGEPAGLWTTWPLATVPQDDPYYSADPDWRGERANCPWNGRVWPMVNSHVCEVLERLSELDPEQYRPRLASFLRRYIEMLHFEKQDAGSHAGKDLLRPNCFEHYHPEDGTACEYRGVDDYMHSWVADLILRYVAGVRVTEQRDNVSVRRTILFDPYPFGLDSFILNTCLVARHEIEVQWNRDRAGSTLPGYRVYVDNALVHESPEICRFEYAL
ncbi:MAG: trehalase family glycosidase, partial [Anaerocolumna sp.]